MIKLFFAVVFTMCFSCMLYAQDNYVADVKVQGNKKLKQHS